MRQDREEKFNKELSILLWQRSWIRLRWASDMYALVRHAGRRYANTRFVNAAFMCSQTLAHWTVKEVQDLAIFPQLKAVCVSMPWISDTEKAATRRKFEAAGLPGRPILLFTGSRS